MKTSSDTVVFPIDLAISLARKDMFDFISGGPITAFVLISAAAELADKGPYDAEAVANALWEELNERGLVREHGNDVL
jgi:hypothetical protein